MHMCAAEPRTCSCGVRASCMGLERGVAVLVGVLRLELWFDGAAETSSCVQVEICG